METKKIYLQASLKESNFLSPQLCLENRQFFAPPSYPSFKGDLFRKSWELIPEETTHKYKSKPNEFDLEIRV